MRYGVRITHKFTGKAIVLGSTFLTIEEQQAYVQHNVCSKCHYVETVYINDDAVYEGRDLGFVLPHWARVAHAHD